ncbi:hypothetical protein JCM19241_5963 [Vibrio ishigakensis]|uniref:Helix-turn-helix domain-containing protein n=1 Tax=Vibrio ishigakensis TaxID=1481914 RepID=A0A0B8QJ40_9VIBR|nr:hypothetical protein JCM19241_5963 [Vibrio ishigakensis]
MISDKLLTPVEASKALGVSLSTLQKWRQNGEALPYVKMARYIKYRLSDIEKFISDHTHQPTKGK